ncbi:MAG: hypothetical protein ACRCXB_28585 [Aeromonadaceae bacterium]
MRALSETERAAARVLAKRLLQELEVELGNHKGNHEECARIVARRVQQESKKHGIPALWLKSSIMRLQDGRI